MSSRLTIEYGQATHQGMVRNENQDFLGKFPPDHDRLNSGLGQLFIVADGLGGHNAGQVASKIAVETISEAYFSNPNETPPRLLKRAFQNANAAIQKEATSNPEYSGMATTCSVLALYGNIACFAHVGDSRVYRITKYTIEQLTRDHSQVAEMERQGILTKEEAEAHPNRSVLTRALGARPQINIDVDDTIELKKGDHFLICTDGLARIQEKELKHITLSNPPQAACDKLIELANERGGHDNATVMIIKITPPQSVGQRLRSFFK